MNKFSILITLISCIYGGTFLSYVRAYNDGDIMVLVAQGTPDMQIDGDSIRYIVDPKTTKVGQLLQDFVNQRKFSDKEGKIPLVKENLNLVTYDNNWNFYPLDLDKTLDEAHLKQLSILRVQNKSDNLSLGV